MRWNFLALTHLGQSIEVTLACTGVVHRQKNNNGLKHYSCSIHFVRKQLVALTSFLVQKRTNDDLILNEKEVGAERIIFFHSSRED